MKTTRTIEAWVLQKLSYLQKGAWVENWVLIDLAQIGEEHRWYHEATMVLQHKDYTYWGVDYQRGRTELQETEWPWDNKDADDPIELYPMQSHVELQIVYKRMSE